MFKTYVVYIQVNVRCWFFFFLKTTDLIYIARGLYAYMRSYCLHSEVNIETSTQVAIMN